MCCQTNALDNIGNDFESGQTDSFKGQQLLGDCSEVNSTWNVFIAVHIYSNPVCSGSSDGQLDCQARKCWISAAERLVCGLG